MHTGTQSSVVFNGVASWTSKRKVRNEGKNLDILRIVGEKIDAHYSGAPIVHYQILLAVQEGATLPVNELT